LQNTASVGTIDNASFSSTATIGLDPYVSKGIACADMNGDGKPDLLTHEGPNWGWGADHFSVFKNIHTSGSITSSSFAAREQYRGNASGILSYLYSELDTHENMVIGDLDGDGRPDLIISDRDRIVFTVIQNQPAPPAITSLSSTSGNPGSSLTITGQNFNTNPANNIVYFGDTKANVTSASGTSLNVTVPFGATFGPISANNTATARTGYSPAFLPSFDHSAFPSGAINFDPKVQFEVSGAGNTIESADLDGDGKTDMIINKGDSIYIYHNIGVSGSVSYSSFAAPVKFKAVPSVPPSDVVVKAGDIDGDGKKDIVCNYGYGFSVLHNTSSPGTLNTASFAVHVDFSTATAVDASYTFGNLQLTDIDGDGKLDVIGVTSSGISIATVGYLIFRNLSAPGMVDSSSFDRPAIFKVGTGYASDWSGGSYFDIGKSFKMADLNNDGKADLVFLISSPFAVTGIGIYKNIGERGWVASDGGYAESYYGGQLSLVDSESVTMDSAYNDVAIGDIDGDGKPDLVARSQSGTKINIIRNISSGDAITFASPVTLACKAISGSPIWGSMGSPEYESPPFEGFFTKIALGDFDGDGKADIVVSNPSDSSVSVFRNTATTGSITSSSFAARQDFPAGQFPSNLLVTDIDGDGKSDIVHSAYPSTEYYYLSAPVPAPKSFSILRNNPAGSVTGSTNICVGSTSTLSAFTSGGTWSSTNTSIATIGSTGVLWGVAPGVAVVSYVYPGGVTTKSVVVDASSVDSITGIMSICAGSYATISSLPVGGAWSSSDASVATINSIGIISSWGPVGTSTISYSVTNACGTMSVSKVLTVNPQPGYSPISGPSSVCAGSTITLGNALTGGTWSTAHPTIVTIDSAGIVTGLSAGVANILYTVTWGACSYTNYKSVTVQTVAPAPTITGPSMVCTGRTATFTRSISGGTWGTSNTALATVNSSGVVTGVAPGTVNIFYTVTNSCGTGIATAVVTVSAAPPAISGPTIVASGTTVTLSNAASGGVWSSTSPEVATIGSSGEITGLSGGLSMISYVFSSGCYASVMMTVNAPSPLISTVAGSGVIGHSGDGGPATSAAMYYPYQVAIDAAGNMYFAELDYHYVRKVSSAGIISTVAGTGTAGYNGDGIAATAAKLNSPYGIAVDAAGNLYISEATNHRIRKVDVSGTISTIAGTGTAGFSGDGGAATAAQLSGPGYLHIDNSGNLLVCDVSNDRIRKINTSGIISTIVGTGAVAFAGDGGPATAAGIDMPLGVWTNSSGNIYISDRQNGRVRKVNSSGIISTIAGGSSGGDGGLATAASISDPRGVYADSMGNVYIAELGTNRIRKINTSGIITTVAGTGVASYNGDGIPATAATLRSPVGVVMDKAGNMYISDLFNERIRKVGAPSALITGTQILCEGYSGSLVNVVTGGAWSSSNTAVATVGSASGIWAGVAAGSGNDQLYVCKWRAHNRGNGGSSANGSANKRIGGYVRRYYNYPDRRNQRWKLELRSNIDSYS
jgi:hypothetical protein